MVNSLSYSPKFDLKARVPDPRFYFFHLIFRSYDYNKHVAGLLPANVCLVTSLSSEQCSQFERSPRNALKW